MVPPLPIRDGMRRMRGAPTECRITSALPVMARACCDYLWSRAIPNGLPGVAVSAVSRRNHRGAEGLSATDNRGRRSRARWSCQAKRVCQSPVRSPPAGGRVHQRPAVSPLMSTQLSSLVSLHAGVGLYGTAADHVPRFRRPHRQSQSSSRLVLSRAPVMGNSFPWWGLHDP